MKVLKVISKTDYGRVILAKHKSANYNYAIKYLYKWKLCKWTHDDDFQKLALSISKYKKIKGIAELCYAGTARNFLFIANEFYKYGSLFHHIRLRRGIDEETARTLTYHLVNTIIDYHKDRRLILYLQTDHVFINDDGIPVIQNYNSQKFNANIRLKNILKGDLTYFCNQYTKSSS